MGKLRTPSKQTNKRSLSTYDRDMSVVQSPRPDNSRGPVSPNSDVLTYGSTTLSAKQNDILKWVRQNGVNPCPETKARMVTPQAIGTAFSNGVLLCDLVAHLEIRAGGRGLNQVSKSMKGHLSLEGVHFTTDNGCMHRKY